MKIKCIRKKANDRPFLDEVSIENETMYVYNRQRVIYRIDLSKITFFEIDYNIVLIGNTDSNVFSVILEEIYDMTEKNIKIDGKTLYGDIFIVKKIDNNILGLTTYEFDKGLDLLNKIIDNKIVLNKMDR